MRKLSFKEAFALWRGKKKGMSECDITVWTLIVIAASSFFEVVFKILFDLVLGKRKH